MTFVKELKQWRREHDQDSQDIKDGDEKPGKAQWS